MRFIVLKKLFIPIILVLSLASCNISADKLSLPVMLAEPDYTAMAETVNACEEREVTVEFLQSLDKSQAMELEKAFEGGYNGGIWHDVIGKSLNILLDKFEGFGEATDLGDNGKSTFELGFAGDINLADGYVMKHAYTMPNGVQDCISASLVETMRAADIMLINNEFCYSDRGEPMQGKQYTFRARPESVENLKQLGVDIVSLANNHVFDYGANAFADTLETLKNAGIAYVGAGGDIERASKPIYYYINGMKVAFVAATRAEKYIMTPEADESSAGVLRTYNPEAFLRVIEQADKVSDVVIAYVHWGTEGTSELEQAQTEQAKQYIEAGADAVLGAHPHVIQGIEFYKGVPIVYSLGNFWFNTKSLDSCMVTLTISQNEEMLLKYYPCRQADSETKLITSPEDRRKLFDYVESISPQEIIIDNEGMVKNG